MDTLDRIIFPLKVVFTEAVRLDQTEPNDQQATPVKKGQIIGRASDAIKTPEGRKVAGYVAAGLVIAAIAGLYAYRQNQRKKPMTRLQHLKTQLGLTDADFKDLKANLSKLDLAQLRELNKAAW